MLIIDHDNTYTAKELKELFSTVGWAMDLSEEMLYNAIRNSSHCVSARVDGLLVGISRSMDDNIWSANIDCVVVHKDYQKQGIGKAMLKKLMEDLSHIKYISAMPDSADTSPLYLAVGFSLIEDSRLLQINQWLKH